VSLDKSELPSSQLLHRDVLRLLPDSQNHALQDYLQDSETWSRDSEDPFQNRRVDYQADAHAHDPMPVLQTPAV
jgi:hypothetical protein